MWQRFTESSRRAIVRAEQEAIKMHAGHVETEHLLLALVKDADCAGAQILQGLGISAEQVDYALAHYTKSDSVYQKWTDDEVEKLSHEFQVDTELIRRIEKRLLLKMGGEFQKPELTLSPKLKRVLELAADDARRTEGLVGHSHVIGTQHLLLGLLRDKECSAVRALHQLGLHLEWVWPIVIEHLREKGAE